MLVRLQTVLGFGFDLYGVRGLSVPRGNRSDSRQLSTIVNL